MCTYSCKKKHQRRNGRELISIKSLEHNFNPMKRSEHLHFNTIMPSRKITELLKLK